MRSGIGSCFDPSSRPRSRFKRIGFTSTVFRFTSARITPTWASTARCRPGFRDLRLSTRGNRARPEPLSYGLGHPWGGAPVLPRGTGGRQRHAWEGQLLGLERIICSAAVCLAWSGLVSAALPASADSAQEIALRHVKTFDLGSNLVPLSLSIAQMTHSYGMIGARIGAESARNLVEAELAKAAPAVRDEWDRIVAMSYLDHFTPEELDSITLQGRRSPFAGKLVSARQDVQASLDSRGKDFITIFVAKALGRALEKSIGTP